MRRQELCVSLSPPPNESRTNLEPCSRTGPGLDLRHRDTGYKHIRVASLSLKTAGVKILAMAGDRGRHLAEIESHQFR